MIIESVILLLKFTIVCLSRSVSSLLQSYVFIRPHHHEKRDLSFPPLASLVRLAIEEEFTQDSRVP